MTQSERPQKEKEEEMEEEKEVWKEENKWGRMGEGKEYT